MRPVSSRVAGLFTLASALSAIAGVARAKDTLAIVAVDPKGDAGRDQADNVADVITTTLVSDGRLKLVERVQIARAMREQALSQSGATSDEGQVQVGKLTGAKWVAVGTVNGDRHTFVLSLRVIETSTAAIAAAERLRVDEGSLDEGAKRLALQVAHRLGGGAQPSSAGTDFDPTLVREAGRGLSQILSRRFPPLEGRIIDSLPNGTATCSLPQLAGFEGQRFEITGYDEVTEQNVRKGLFLLTSYSDSLCAGRLRPERGQAIEEKDRLKSLPMKISHDPLELGEGAEAEMAKLLFEETKAFLKLVPQFELASPAEAQLTTSARIAGPRGKRTIQVQVMNAKSGQVIRQLDLVGTF